MYIADRVTIMALLDGRPIQLLNAIIEWFAPTMKYSIPPAVGHSTGSPTLYRF